MMSEDFEIDDVKLETKLKKEFQFGDYFDVKPEIKMEADDGDDYHSLPNTVVKEERQSEAEDVEPDSAVEDVKPEIKVKTVVRVVPWYNADEFRKVSEYLYSSDLEKINWAIDTISVWETRCHPSLPIAIDCTYLLASAIVQDILWKSGKTLNRFIDVQLMYCNAIIRFVNMTVDAHKDDTEYSTMTKKAKELGIPSYIVDLRNEACHFARPSLELLRLAAEEAMNYLKESYWQPEAALVKNHRRSRLDRKEIKQSLTRYLKVQIEIVKNRKNGEELGKKVKDQLRQCLMDISRLIEQNNRHFIDVLVNDNIFIPLDEEMKLIVSKEVYEAFTDIHDENVDDKSCPVPKASCIPEVPDLHEALWLPVIYKLNLFEIVPLFLEALLASQGDRSVIGQKMVLAWVISILRIFDDTKITEENYSGPSSDDEKKDVKKISVGIRKVFRKKGMVASWHSMFYSALKNPCNYTPIVLPLIICHLKDCDAAVQRFTTLLSIYLGHTIDENTPMHDRIFTVDDLKRAKRVQEAKASLNDELEECLFTECADEEYRSWPIGYRITSAKGQREEEEDEEEDEAYDENKFKQKVFSDDEDTSDDCIENVVKPIPLPTFDDIKRELESRGGSSFYKYDETY